MRIALIASLLALTACAPIPVTVSKSSQQPTRAIGAPDASELNAYRRANGLASLIPNARLAVAATSHARDMAANGYTNHRGRDGSTHSQRANRAGYRSCGAAENIAWGRNDRAAAMRMWQTSPSHNANLLNARVLEYGYGAAGERQVLLLARPC